MHPFFLSFSRSCHAIDLLDYFLLQLNSPIRSEVDIKLGGTQFNLILNRLEPWMSIRLPKKQKKESSEKSPAKEKSLSSEQKKIMWTCTLSAPEMTIVLFSLSGFPLYHVRIYLRMNLLCFIRIKCFSLFEAYIQSKHIGSSKLLVYSKINFYVSNVSDHDGLNDWCGISTVR